MTIKFICISCGQIFEKEIDTDLAEILTEVDNGELLFSSCCKGENGTKDCI